MDPILLLVLVALAAYYLGQRQARQVRALDSRQNRTTASVSTGAEAAEGIAHAASEGGGVHQ